MCVRACVRARAGACVCVICLICDYGANSFQALELVVSHSFLHVEGETEMQVIARWKMHTHASAILCDSR